MRIGAVGYVNNSVSFGRALTPEEMKTAYDTALKAREAQGFSEGKNVLLLQSKNLPKADEEGAADKLKQFIESAKKLLGVNTVEVAGDTELPVGDVLSKSGIKRVVSFNPVDDKSTLAEAVKEAAKFSDGLRVTQAQNYSKEELDLIEAAFKEVKGDNFDPKAIFYDVNNDALFDWGSETITERFRGRTVVGSSNYLNDNSEQLWGSRSFFTDRMKAPQGDFIHGIRRGGEPTLKEQMHDPGQVNQAIHLLENELKAQDDEFGNAARFAAAKRADAVSSQNFYRIFDDIAPGSDINVSNFEQVYHKALQEGTGENFFDSLAKTMKAQGLDETQSELYESVCKFRNALFASGPTTMEEAAKMSADELEASYKSVQNVVLQGVEEKKAIIEAQKLLDEKKALEEAQKLAEDKAAKLRVPEIKVGDDGFVNTVVNFGRRHKTGVIAASAVAAIALIGATMYSYGKEIASKTKNATPKPEPRLEDKKA